MYIKLSPVPANAPTTLSVSGDTLTVNGVTFDFADLPEGGDLPAEAIVSDDITGPVKRVDGVLHLTVRLGYQNNASSEQTRFPEPVTVATNGLVDLPPWGYEPDEDGTPQAVYGKAPAVTSEGMIDWSQMTTPESREQAALQEWRATAAIDRATFSILAATYGYITEDEAEKWASGTALPQFVADIIAASVPPEMRLARRIMALTQPTIGRDSEMIPAIAEAKGLTDEQVDAMFGWQGG